MFTSDFRVLPLSAYDLIVGMDWLEANSAMQVHWKLKWLEIPYKGTRRVMQGLLPTPSKPLLLQVCCSTADQVVLNVPGCLHRFSN